MPFIELELNIASGESVFLNTAFILSVNQSSYHPESSQVSVFGLEHPYEVVKSVGEVIAAIQEAQ